LRFSGFRPTASTAFDAGKLFAIRWDERHYSGLKSTVVVSGEALLQHDLVHARLAREPRSNTRPGADQFRCSGNISMTDRTSLDLIKLQSVDLPHRTL
jgi:hypothetical protein